jgi:hypothetical protein
MCSRNCTHFKTEWFEFAFTAACHLILSWTKNSGHALQPYFIYWSVLILCSNLSLGVPSDLLPSGFLARDSFLSNSYHMPFQSQPPWFDFPQNNLCLVIFLITPLHTLPLRPLYVLRRPILEYHQLIFSLNLRGQFCHSHNEIRKIVVL